MFPDSASTLRRHILSSLVEPCTDSVISSPDAQQTSRHEIFVHIDAGIQRIGRLRMEFPIGLLRTGRRHGTIIGTPFRGRVHIIGLYGKLRTERVDIERIVECGLILRKEHLAVICVLPEGIRLRISRYLSAYRGYGSVVTAVKPDPDREADRMTVGSKS